MALKLTLHFGNAGDILQPDTSLLLQIVYGHIVRITSFGRVLALFNYYVTHIMVMTCAR